MDHWRKSGRRARRETADDDAIALAPDDPEAGPLGAALAGEARERLAASLEALPDEQRTAFLLYVEGGLSLAEIGEVTGANPETAKSRLRYAVARLKRTLAAETGAD
jgi:RNA polymerase sigma-70 factor (ECF subfamily)